MSPKSPYHSGIQEQSSVAPEAEREDERKGLKNNSANETRRPPLPPRPTNLSLLGGRPLDSHPEGSLGCGLVAEATTAVSMTDVDTQAFHDCPSELDSSHVTSPSSQVAFRHGVISSPRLSDTTSLQSHVPYSDNGEEVRTLFGDQVAVDDRSSRWSSRGDDIANLQFGRDGDPDFTAEFDDIPAIDEGESNEETVYALWKSKKKHFIILSAAGKPIYTRHGSDGVISSYVGIIQTIISFYQSTGNSLRSFSSGDVRFVILSQANMFLVATSRLIESDSQLQSQLEALYLQILSTLTLPNLTHIFSVRPSSDLKRPLKGTEVLLSSLADGFTRGSPSTLLSALESLKLRKSQREVINSTLLKSRVDDLLYGLVVAGGRLVSVIRPRKHSLHPGDLQLIFNMLFEAEGVKAGGGESWIPLCLPGFNPNGFLYMFVSFLNLADEIHQAAEEEEMAKEDAVAIILVSANKEGFDSIRSMKDYLVDELARNKSLTVIQSAIRAGRPSPTDIIPGTVLRHFLYKSKSNVQFCMPSLAQYEATLPRRKLFSIYHELHASVHTKHAGVKVHHSVSASHTAFAWVTPNFELYCISGPAAGRNALVQNANKVVQWVNREGERLFIVGGAVF